MTLGQPLITKTLLLQATNSLPRLLKGVRSPIFLLFLMGFAYLAPGLIGHDPWKADEGYSFGLINHILKSGDWVVPTLAGEPFMEKPPLYYIIAAAFAHSLESWLPLHDGARLASGLFAALTFLFVGLFGREAWGTKKSLTSIVMLGGCLGLVEPAHQIITDIALLSGIALAFYGLLLSLRRTFAGGIALGTGVGIAFMSKGLIGPGLIVIIALSLPLIFHRWRNRHYASCLLVAFASAFPWLTLWPIALYQRSPALFESWFWINNVGRYVGFAHLGADSEPWFYVRTLMWFAFPAFPLAMWTAWKLRRELVKDAALQLAILSFVLMALVLVCSASARAVYALPLLVPISVIAARGLESLSSRFSVAFSALARVAFGLSAMGLWLVWIQMQCQGHLPGWPWLVQLVAMDFVPKIELVPTLLALVITIIWLWGPRRIESPSYRSLTIWSLGVALVWGLLTTLWLPLIDTTRSYQATFTSMDMAMSQLRNCVTGKNLGESERAMLEYFDDLITIRPEQSSAANCDYLLVEEKIDESRKEISGDWRPIWHGHRPGDRRERFILLQHLSHVRGRVHEKTS